jgi:phosphoglucosamine mutase
VVISASHNPFEFNGIKFFNSKGYKLPDATEDKIEELVRNGFDNSLLPSGAGIGRRKTAGNTVRDYVDFLKGTIENDLAGLKIAVDCANGASYQAAPILFEELGAQVFAINNCPDGVNINRDCGSTHILQLKEYVKKCGADVGLAFDGDADRVLAVDENGELVDGDRILAIIGLELKKAGQLANDTIVVTVMSNIGLDVMARENGLKLVKTKVGDRYVLEEMLDKGYVLGGEQSGHIIFLEHNTTGDGLLTALQLLNVMKSTGKRLSELAAVMQVLPQVLINAKVRNENKHRYMEDELIARHCCELEEEFKGEGRVLIRPSGTEPLVRVMIEGRDKEYITKRAAELAALIEERLCRQE